MRVRCVRIRMCLISMKRITKKKVNIRDGNSSAAEKCRHRAADAQTQTPSHLCVHTHKSTRIRQHAKALTLITSKQKKIGRREIVNAKKGGKGVWREKGREDIQKERLNRREETEKKFAIIYKSKEKLPSQWHATLYSLTLSASLDNQGISNIEQKKKEKKNRIKCVGNSLNSVYQRPNERSQRRACVISLRGKIRNYALRRARTSASRPLT